MLNLFGIFLKVFSLRNFRFLEQFSIGGGYRAVIRWGLSMMFCLTFINRVGLFDLWLLLMVFMLWLPLLVLMILISF